MAQVKTAERTSPNADRSHLTAVPILANPYSGAGPNVRRVARLAEALRERGLDAEPVWDISDRTELLWAPDLAHRVRCLVVAGGDGSIGDVISDLAAANSGSEGELALPPMPLATLAMGNENLFARQLGFNRDPHKLAAMIEAGRTRGIDVGQAGSRLFTIMVSSGFDSDVVEHVEHWRARGTELRRIRRRSYAPIILGRLRGYRFPQVAVEVDGQVHTGSHAFVFNMPQYGGGLPIGEGAKDDDGLLDWFVFRKPGLVALGGYGLSVVSRHHRRSKNVIHGRAKRVRLLSRAANPTAVQCDGDPAGRTPVDVQVHASALQVITR